jgi:O-antigen/teichoic acid export membrane protein
MSSIIVPKLIRAVIVSGTGNLVQKASMFIGVLVVVRYIPQEELGPFFILLLISNLFTTLNGLFLDDLAIAKNISSSNEDLKADVANVAISYKCIFTLLTCPAIFFLLPLISDILGLVVIKISTNYVCLLFVLMNLNALFLRVLQGFYEFKKMAIVQIVEGFSRLSLILLFVVMFNYGVVGMLYSYLCSGVISLLIVPFFVPFKLKTKLKLSIFKELFRFGFPLGMNGCLSFLFTRIDKFMISSMMSPASVAVYVAGSQIPQTIRELFKSFHNVFFPNMSELYARKQYKEVEKLFNNSMRIISFFTCFISYVVFVFQVEIVSLLFSEKYLESAPVLAILSFALCVALSSNIIGTSLVAFGRSETPVKINIIDTVVNASANFILIPMYGLKGAAFATLLSRCSTNPVNVWFLRSTGIKVEIGQYLKPIFLCIAGYGVCHLLQPESLFLKTVLIALYPIVCLGLCIIKKSDIFYVFDALRTPIKQASV